MKLTNNQGEAIDSTLHTGEKKDHLVLLAHGVTGDKDRDMMVSLASTLTELGWSTLRFSFSGNGGSGGRFEDSTISKGKQDLRAILDQVQALQPTTAIHYIGYSMGGAIGTLTAAADPRIRALTTLAGMVNTARFCETEFGEETPDQGCMWEDTSKPLSSQFVNDLMSIKSTLSAAKSIQQPTLLIHGDEDDVVLAQDSVDFYEQLTAPKKHCVIEGTDHSFQGHWESMAETIHQWLLKYS